MSAQTARTMQILPMDAILTKRNTIIVVALLALWKMYFAATLQLHPDEAYYWLWSRHLDFGYFDHAPLIAYLIRLTTLLSQQELWVRFGGIIEAVVVSVLAWVLSIQLFNDRKIASASVITLNVLPLTLAGSVIITPDIPVFLFISLSIFLYWQIVATQKPLYWYLLGIAFGLALLSKYTAVLLAPSLVLFMLVTDERRWFKTIHPYAGFLLGCAFFLPVVYWNSRHQWISFAFQMRHGLGGNRYNVGKVLVYLGGQMLVAGPLLWIAGIYASALYLFQKNKEKLFLVLTSLPTILFFAFSAFKKGNAAANWPCFAYFSFSILAGHFCFSGSTSRKALWTAAVLLSAALSMTAALHARFGVIPLEKISKDAAEADASQAFYGWKELARELQKDPAAKVVVTTSHQLAAEVSYYTNERIYAYVDYTRFAGPQFSFWKPPEGIQGANGACVCLKGEACPSSSDYFEKTAPASELPFFWKGFLLRTYLINRGSGYAFLPPVS